MQIAAKHAKRQRVGTGQRVKERFLLGRIACQRRHVIHGHAQMTTLVEANFANATLAFINQTAVAARVTLDRVLRKMLG